MTQQSLDQDNPPTDDEANELGSDELVVEEISIDGMCGVY